MGIQRIHLAQKENCFSRFSINHHTQFIGNGIALCK